jgi:hypothetical protein
MMVHTAWLPAFACVQESYPRRPAADGNDLHSIIRKIGDLGYGSGRTRKNLCTDLPLFFRFSGRHKKMQAQASTKEVKEHKEISLKNGVV